jgi:hypothetical protein
MNKPTFLPSSLEVKASASLQDQVEKELQIIDPDKSIAKLLSENYEKKENQNDQNKDQNPQENPST